MVAELADIPRESMNVRGSSGTLLDVIEDGAFGSCRLLLDARHPFAIWLVRAGHGHLYTRGIVELNCRATSGSLSRAIARARAMGDVLKSAGVHLSVDSHLD